jgi:hypothetical protein
MSSHDLTATVYLLIGLAGVTLELVGRRPSSDIPPIGQVLARIMHTRSGRIGVMAGWVWLGLHYFAR